LFDPYEAKAKEAKKGLWASIPSGRANAIDASPAIEAFKGYFIAVARGAADVHPCIPNGIINALDVALEVDALKGVPCYCSPPCH
jgi:hypothetical protein